jgi:hypothetical protein
MFIIQSINGKDPLLLNGFCYRPDKLIWRCVKDKCKGRARHNGIVYETYQDHLCQAPDPDQIEKAAFIHEIRTKAEQCHDAPRLLIQDVRLKLSSDAAAIIPQYTASGADPENQ